MIITSLIDNISMKGMATEHGLSLHMHLNDGRRILFDMGQGRLFMENAERLGISVKDVDMAVVSHGHYDHGGGLRVFLENNDKAKVYMSRYAFEPHFSLRDTGMKNIGLSSELSSNDRLVYCDNLQTLDGGITLFSGVHGDSFYPRGNRLLYGPVNRVHDDFRHEQSMVIEEDDKTVLFAGCAHAGIVNIIHQAERVVGKRMTHIFAGMHLVKSGLEEKEERDFVCALADRLMEHPNSKYVTMHCTGIGQYEMMKDRMCDAIVYMSCGDKMRI